MSNFNAVQYNGIFDATQYEPVAGGGRPLLDEGWYFAQVTSTEIKPTRDGQGGFLAIELALAHCETGATGEFTQRLNLWASNQVAQEIAHKQLSAICHITGIFKLNMGNQARELVGAKYRVQIKIKEQSDTRTNAVAGATFKSNDIGQFTDMQGNAPGKAAPAQQGSVPTGVQGGQPPIQPAAQPQQWGTPPATQPQPATQPSVQPSWGGQPATQPQPSAPPANMPWGR
jgi:hypothetical protein